MSKYIKYSITFLSLATITLYVTNSINAMQIPIKVLTYKKPTPQEVPTLLELATNKAFHIAYDELKPMLTELKNASLEKQFAPEKEQKEKDKKIIPLIKVIKDYFLRLPTTHPNLLKSDIYKHIYDATYSDIDKLTMSKLQIALSEDQPANHLDIWYSNEIECYDNFNKLKRAYFESDHTIFINEIASLPLMGVMTWQKNNDQESFYHNVKAQETPYHKYKIIAAYEKGHLPSSSSKARFPLPSLYRSSTGISFCLDEISPETINHFIKTIIDEVENNDDEENTFNKEDFILYLFLHPLIENQLLHNLFNVILVKYPAILEAALHKHSCLLCSIFNLVLARPFYTLEYWPIFRNYLTKVNFWEQLDTKTRKHLQEYVSQLADYVREESQAFDFDYTTLHEWYINDLTKWKNHILRMLSHITEATLLLEHK